MSVQLQQSDLIEWPVTGVVVNEKGVEEPFDFIGLFIRADPAVWGKQVAKIHATARKKIANDEEPIHVDVELAKLCLKGWHGVLFGEEKIGFSDANLNLMLSQFPYPACITEAFVELINRGKLKTSKTSQRT
jgi:hypothetical protein